MDEQQVIDPKFSDLLLVAGVQTAPIRLKINRRGVVCGNDSGFFALREFGPQCLNARGWSGYVHVNRDVLESWRTAIYHHTEAVAVADDVHSSHHRLRNGEVQI